MIYIGDLLFKAEKDGIISLGQHEIIEGGGLKKIKRVFLTLVTQTKRR